MSLCFQSARKSEPVQFESPSYKNHRLITIVWRRFRTSRTRVNEISASGAISSLEGLLPCDGVGPDAISRSFAWPEISLRGITQSLIGSNFESQLLTLDVAIRST